MNMDEQMREMAASARQASQELLKVASRDKERALVHLARLITANREAIFAANARDIEAATARGMDAARIDRLRLTDATIESMAEACRFVAKLSDPVGEIESLRKRPNGLLVGRMRIPLGVIAIIYESRPNVTIDAAILCLRAGNAVILRGGSEAFHSNQALGGLLAQAMEEAGLPAKAVQLVPTTDRAAVKSMLNLDEYIDVVIPRGGEGLIRAVVKDATMPVLKHYKGVCHIYVDACADQDKGLRIVHNAKVQRPGVCNALECLLVHKDVAAGFLPRVGERLGRDNVVFKACPRSLPLLGDKALPARDDDFGKEFHSLELAVKVVDSQTEAQEHIATYGSHHSEAIITMDHDRAMRFLREVDASAVLINASTRFNDGGELGLGAEIGISTSKLHSYGPMGVRELTSTKFVVLGEGQIRE
ncbi:glutamate-5-semialdehyde dehydrogenase [Desulfoplanes formicivorans]|uniref:Gamma-glutamyl phosphate reductase n=1 Tax=Desulfoplanes formicivorans TaxID=1592317 RepID=A0A194AED9_9BACT|nr:glutamate-5-semialdehyde dehydrogenase [Desulfoplanes formicivorans]GAU07693.1 gamma-glutamyl phosphate reductase [Desulfoplanes formicivorans]